MEALATGVFFVALSIVQLVMTHALMPSPHLTMARNIVLACAFCAFALFAYAPLTSAHEGESRSGTSKTSTSTQEQLEKDVRKFMGNSLENRNGRSIQEKISQVERRLAEMRRQVTAYETLLAQLKARASSTPTTASSTTGWKPREGEHGGFGHGSSTRPEGKVVSQTTTDTTPTITGTAKNVTSVGLVIGGSGGKVYGSGSTTISVTNGQWSHTVPALSVGFYTVKLYSSTNQLLGQGTLRIQAPGAVRGASTMSFDESVNQLKEALMRLSQSL